MTRALTADMQTELAKQVMAPVILYEGEFESGTTRLWSGIGPLAWNGNTFLGAGQLLGLSAVEETVEVRAVGVEVSLSGIPSALVSLALGEARMGNKGRLWLGFMGEVAAHSGIAQDGSSDTLTLAAAAPESPGVVVGRLLQLTDGTNRERRVVGYDGVTKVATVESAWPVNFCQYSEQVDQWPGSADVASNAFADPDGEMTIDTLTDDNAAAYENRTRAITVPNDSATWLLSCLIRKDLAAAQRCGFDIGLAGGTPVNANPRLALDGTNVGGGGSPTMTSYDAEYWLLEMSITNNSSGNTTLNVAAYPATSATKGGGDNVAGTGSMSMGRMHVRRSTDSAEYVKAEAAAIDLPTASTPYDLIDTGVIADPYLVFEGLLDVPVIEETGEDATIRLSYESELIALDTPNEIRYTDEDQRARFPNDAGFSAVARLQDLDIVW